MMNSGDPTLNPCHHSRFRQTLEKFELTPDKPGGKSWSMIWGVEPELSTPDIPQAKGQFSRSEIFELASNPEIQTKNVCAAILAWGGIHKGSLSKFFANPEDWVNVANDLRAGNLNRQNAYKEFANLRRQAKLKGIGPAFFTKLIYFLGRQNANKGRPQGYISDQWTTRSINLLTGENIMHLNCLMTPSTQKPKFTYTVSDQNEAKHYERFCNVFDKLVDQNSIEKLERTMNIDNIDHALQRKGCWRDYIIETLPS